ncbi:hypothetical protein EMIHUDRAFT_449834 [Emiliania huxleyi CCMP1516]|uniref:Uncharacterized protein n=2 Tax=Emiliania huxleyi TaxID=2903 RepID=A0A0D3K0F7_EMIH1|nr:hypothetical protein EMIHUDRAFT_449834 [Emiliania huxleyi CCMP1516]EOD29242.1 hypothetical protein EMIHUDRAFT_449834 [Emiliania huxleyi CCMP1516]|eukprot:XP_005781671.1 hypothetical protein EMIHUDRAFT_449834 [Emiliania huxleyi CCMP1516]
MPSPPSPRTASLCLATAAARRRGRGDQPPTWPGLEAGRRRGRRRRRRRGRRRRRRRPATAAVAVALDWSVLSYRPFPTSQLRVRERGGYVRSPEGPLTAAGQHIQMHRVAVPYRVCESTAVTAHRTAYHNNMYV